MTPQTMHTQLNSSLQSFLDELSVSLTAADDAAVAAWKTRSAFVRFFTRPKRKAYREPALQEALQRWSGFEAQFNLPPNSLSFLLIAAGKDQHPAAASLALKLKNFEKLKAISAG